MDYETWQLEKTKCARCAHRITDDDPKRAEKQTIWRCAVTPSKRRGSPHQYCNYARDPGEACGPDARLFEANVRANRPSGAAQE